VFRSNWRRCRGLTSGRIGLAERERELLEKNGEEWIGLIGSRIAFGAFSARGLRGRKSASRPTPLLSHTFEMLHLWHPSGELSVDQMGSVEVFSFPRGKLIAAHIARENLVLPLGWADFHSPLSPRRHAPSPPVNYDLLQRLGFVPISQRRSRCSRRRGS